MKLFFKYFLPVLFPFTYICIDIGIRYQYLINYSHLQLLFYIASILFSISLFLFTIVMMVNENRKYFTGILSAVYYSFTILSSYTFVFSTGIFPNFYTFTYFKNEPANAFSLLKDSIHLWQILIFTLLAISLFYFFLHLSGSIVFKIISLKAKPVILIVIIFTLLIILVSNIRKCDQCMIVDTNFTVDVCKHLSEWNTATAFTGDGLPLRNPLKLNRSKKDTSFNVLLIIFESLRKQNMQIYGYGRETTPFLSSLYKAQPDNLYLFKNAYTVSTTTMLAIPAILSGVAPEQPLKFFKTFPLVWEYAKILNYQTFFISSQSMKWYRFDTYYSAGKPDFFWNKDNSGLPSFNDSGIEDRLTTDRLNKHISEIEKKPFFGVMQFNTTHFPYKVTEEFLRWDGKYIDNYDNSILLQDALLEKVFSNLSKRDLLKNTVVIMIGDHGEAFKEHNSIGHIDTYNAETISIPLMIYIPPGISSRINSAQLKLNTQLNTSNADIVPTVINLLGLRNDKQISSFYSDFSGINLLEPFDTGRSIITLNSNEIINFNSGISMIKNNYHYILRTNIVPYSREFYDTIYDPDEKNNIIESVNRELIDTLNRILAENSNYKKILNLFYPIPVK